MSKNKSYRANLEKLEYLYSARQRLNASIEGRISDDGPVCSIAPSPIKIMEDNSSIYNICMGSKHITDPSDRIDLTLDLIYKRFDDLTYNV